MAWLKSHTVLIRHRKLIDLSHDLHIRPVYAMGHLHALWHEVLEQQEDGDLSRWSDEFIATCAAFPGDAPRFVSTLKKHGWMDENRLLHDWLDYAGEFLRGKYKTRNCNKMTEIFKKHGKTYTKDEFGPDMVRSRSGVGPDMVRLDKIDKREKKERDSDLAHGAIQTANGPYLSQGVPKPRYCVRCKIERVIGDSENCLECSCCSQCKEPYESLEKMGDLWICAGCKTLSGVKAE